LLWSGVYFTMEWCVFYYGVVCILLWSGVYFTMVLSSKTLLLSQSHFPKYYKVLKNYKGNIKARVGVCFVSLF
ncbi:hypothetical protein, partial [Enterococcus faecalis]|uniref:hypothetical protein n=1 Tax=Enterococcus faecalis TaxID=1351 RepID=UPI001E35A939